MSSTDFNDSTPQQDVANTPNTHPTSDNSPHPSTFGFSLRWWGISNISIPPHHTINNQHEWCRLCPSCYSWCRECFCYSIRMSTTNEDPPTTQTCFQWWTIVTLSDMPYQTEWSMMCNNLKNHANDKPDETLNDITSWSTSVSRKTSMTWTHKSWTYINWTVSAREFSSLFKG